MWAARCSEIVFSVVLFSLVSSLQIAEQTSVVHLINNIFHCEKVLIFDKQFDVFSALLDSPENMAEAEKELTNTVLGGEQYETKFDSSEKAALTFGGVAFAFVVCFSLVLSANVDLKYEPVKIICSHVPDDGIHVSFDAETSFSIFSGKTLDTSPDEIMDKCVSLFSDNIEEIEDAIVDYDVLEEDSNGEFGGDVLAEIDAVESLQSASDANALMQADAGNKIIVAAHYRSWKEAGVNRLERDFVIVDTGADEVDEDDKENVHDKGVDGGDRRRSLSSTTAGLTAVATGSTFSSTSLTTFSKPHTYSIDITVGDGHYDGSKGEITMKIFGKDSDNKNIESSFLNLGKSFMTKGDVVKIDSSDTVDVAEISKVLLTTNSKDSLKLSSIIINRKAEGTKKGGSEANMKSSLKCRGSKRKKTWSCTQELSVKFFDNGEGEEEEEEEVPDESKKGCKFEACKYTIGALGHNDISNFSNDVAHRDELEYVRRASEAREPCERSDE